MVKRKRSGKLNAKARSSRVQKSQKRKVVGGEEPNPKRRKSSGNTKQRQEETPHENMPSASDQNYYPRFDPSASTTGDPFDSVDGWDLFLDETTILKLESVIHGQEQTGRFTTVTKAKRVAGDWEESEVVVKICVSSRKRRGEDELVKIAVDKANELGDDHAWAKDHLPRILWSKTYDVARSTPQYQLISWLTENFLSYEAGALCITVQTVLHPLIDLDKPEEFAQVFFDVLQIHRWLVDYPKVLHRDINRGNVMFRRETDGSVRGVLNDFDWALELPPPPGPLGTMRVGAPPYMSHDLLRKDWERGHEYRHDLEGLFYVMLIVCCHYEERDSKIQKLARELAYNSWYQDDDHLICARKSAWIFTWEDSIPVTSFFSNFTNVLFELKGLLVDGQIARHRYGCTRRKKEMGMKRLDVVSDLGSDQGLEPDTEVPFDWQTMGGHVSYEKFKEFMCNFNGKRLVERYKEEFIKPIQESDFIPREHNSNA
ncbi:hypothetical protein VKT23_003440 [Stygiomarasmius scandens]|uniref:Protein kinase domain-containing protein n=1 Tax=Marasmiellus scandens TaxID=2682957 RepID=A0ABR1JXX5_9AGAR